MIVNEQTYRGVRIYQNDITGNWFVCLSTQPVMVETEEEARRMIDERALDGSRGEERA